MTPEQLAQELHIRAIDQGRTRETLEFCTLMSRLIFKYDIDLTLDSFKDLRGVILKDGMGRTVGLYPVTSMNGTIRSERAAFTDILVLVEGNIVLGWVPERDARPLDDTFVLSSKTINRMPKEFNFAQECPHMSVHGGVWNKGDSGWTCFGCGKLLVGV